MAKFGNFRFLYFASSWKFQRSDLNGQQVEIFSGITAFEIKIGAQE